MRLRQKSWAILVVVALAFTTALSAAAKPDCDVDDSHPSCQATDKEPLAGTECVVFSPDDPYAYPVSDDFWLSVPVGGETDVPDVVCIDVTEAVAGDWEVTVDVTRGSLDWLLVSVRDSVAPGDVCTEIRFMKKKVPSSPFTFTLSVDAADTVNACGTDYAEMVGNDYYAGQLDVQSPLAFLMGIRGSSDLVFTVDVDYPNAS